MRKYLAILCAGMLCACCLALAACGGSSSSSAASSGSASASASASSSAADAAEQFVGTWKLAGAETQGITVAGDFSALVGTDMNVGLDINKDGTAQVTLNGEAGTATWTASGNEITITPDPKDSASSASASSEAASDSSASASSEAASGSSASADASTAPLKGTVKDGVLTLTSAAEEEYNMLFTKDGKLANAPEIDSAATTPITSEDALVGTWKLSGMNMMGITMYGDADALAAMSGTDDLTMVFEKGGKATVGGQEASYTVSADGATLTQGGQNMPIKALGDDIALDMSDMVGMPMIMVFSK